MMGFAQDVNEIRSKIDALKDVSKILTPEVISNMSKVSLIDMELLEKIVIASEKIHKSRKDVLLVENGLSDIRHVSNMQNQVANVSDNRDSISKVAGSIDNVIKISDYMSQLNYMIGMKPMLDKLFNMEESIRSVISATKEINTVSKIADGISAEIEEIEIIAEQCQRDVEHAANLMNAAGQAERRIDEKLKEMESIEKRMQQFSVSVVHANAETKTSSRYNPTKNELQLTIPKGKEGTQGKPGIQGIPGKQGRPGTAVEKGEPGDIGRPGRNGNNFSIDLKGNKSDIKRYGNRVMGTSFLSLDEKPVMIYFKRSDALDHWTDGQPFGVSIDQYVDYTSGVNIYNGINIVELVDHILKEIERRKENVR